MADVKCVNCDYYEAGEPKGFCHRYPPRGKDSIVFHDSVYFDKVEASIAEFIIIEDPEVWWCGEFKSA